MKSLGASPDLKPSRKAAAESSDADSTSPSKRKTRGLIEEKAVKGKESKKLTKSTDDEVTSERDDTKKKKVCVCSKSATC